MRVELQTLTWSILLFLSLSGLYLDGHSTESRAEGMDTEACAMAPFFWSGKAHGRQ